MNGRLVLLVAVLLLPRLSEGAEVFDQFFKFADTKNKSLEPHLPGEVVDHFTGNLTIEQEDLRLPGKAGLDLRIFRTYSSKIWNRTDQIAMEPLIADKEPTPVGLGWKMHLGRLRNPFASGAPLSCGEGDYPIYEAPDGASRVFYPVPNAVGQFISRDFWLLSKNCATAAGTGICIKSTSGLKLEFADASRFYVGGALATPGACPNGDGYNCMLPMTRTIDVFNNQITATYVGSTGRPNVVTDTWSREVTFAYSICGSRQCLDSITATGIGGGARQVTYVYTQSTVSPLPAPGRAFLSEVHPQTGPGYSYSYGFTNAVSNNKFALTSITYPFGGTTTYDYETRNFFTGNEMIPFAVVTRRETSGRSLVPSIFRYDYLAPQAGPDTGFAKTTITRPDGKTDVYKFFGFGGPTVSGMLWRVGLLDSVTRGDSAETETRVWDQGEVVSQAAFPAPLYGTGCPNLLTDLNVRAPVLTKRIITRGASSYEIEFSNHDSFGQPRTITETGEAQRPANQRAVKQTKLTYDYVTSTNQVMGRVLTEDTCPGLTTVGCASSSRSYYSGSSGNGLHTETVHGVQTTFDYTAEGNLFRVTNALNQKLELSGYATGYGIPTSVDFNGAFSFTREAYWDGSLKSETDGHNHKTSYTYDADGRPSTVTPPTSMTEGPSETITYEYSPNGLFYSKRRGAEVGGYRERFDFDGLGRTVLSRRGPSMANSGFSSTDSRVVRNFDAFGRVEFESYPMDATSTPLGDRHEYDALGRLATTSHRFPLGDLCSIAAQCTTTSIAQDLEHCRTTTVQRTATDAVATKSCYESFGDLDHERLVKLTDAKLKLWNYSYDVLDHLTDFDAPLAQGDRWATFTPTTFFPKKTGSHSRGETTVINHNVIGQPTLQADARISTSFDYTDPLSRLRKITYGAGSADDVTQTYDKELLRTISSDNGGSYTYTRDELGRVTSQSWVPVAGGPDFVTQWKYNSAGCLYETTYPTGTVVTNACDKAGRQTSVSLGAENIVNQIVYSPEGRPTSMTYGNGKVVSTVMERGRVKSIASTGVMSLTYTYDGASNVTGITDAITPALTASPIVYDALDRLERVTTPGGVFSFTYDELGNRKSKTVPGAGTTDFTYDPLTNRLQKSVGPGGLAPGMTLQWSDPGKLSWSSDGATYLYDGLGRRVKKVVPSQSVDILYHYDGAGRLLAETLPSGIKIREYFYVGRQLIAVDGCITSFSVGCGEREWYHSDLVGTVVARTNDRGMVSARLNYHPWGEAVGSTSGTLLFNGRTFDSGTGFYDFGARPYSPALGRFLSTDPVWVSPSNGQTSNQYSFVLNNPYKYVDPTGESALSVVAGTLLNLNPVLDGLNDVPQLTCDVKAPSPMLANFQHGLAMAIEKAKAANWEHTALLYPDGNGPNITFGTPNPKKPAARATTALALPMKDGQMVIWVGDIIIGKEVVQSGDTEKIAHAIVHEVAHWARWNPLRGKGADMSQINSIWNSENEDGNRNMSLRLLRYTLHDTANEGYIAEHEVFGGVK